MKYVLASGLMGSGKTEISTYMANHLGFYRVHPGTIRDTVYANLHFNDQKLEAALRSHILTHAVMIAESALEEGKDVVIENEALKNRTKHRLLDGVDSADVKKYWIILDADTETRIKRVIERPKGFGRGLNPEQVKELVYGDMAQWEEPDLLEGVEIIRYRNENGRDLENIKRDLGRRFR